MVFNHSARLSARLGSQLVRAVRQGCVTSVNQLDVEQKESVLATCIPVLNGVQSRKNDAVRIVVVRVIVALLPTSLAAIADLLSRYQNKHHYEVHFTLFCYLDWAQEMPDAFSLTEDVLLLVENYLMTVPRKTARAAWMAGDMLGEHWNEQEAVPLLMKTAQGAKYSVGRLQSVFGLAHMLDRLPVKSDTHKSILKALRKISSSDPSKDVRKNAKGELRDWRKSLRK